RARHGSGPRLRRGTRAGRAPATAPRRPARRIHHQRLARDAPMMTIDPLRWGSALALVLTYGGMCAAMLRKRKPAATDRAAAAADWLVVYASQTGTAEYLAQQTVATLATGGLSARALCISALDGAALGTATRILF